jgi:hypothetical protein
MSKFSYETQILQGNKIESMQQLVFKIDIINEWQTVTRNENGK